MTINTDTRPNQVRTYLLNYIVQHQLKRNDQLPSEMTMAKMLGVSRNTIREAYIALENEGIIVRRHGIGTFVARSPVIRDSLNTFFPFAQIIRDSGYTPTFQTLSVQREKPSAEVSEALELPSSEVISHIKRLVLADQRPVIFVDDYLSPSIDITKMDWDTFDGRMVRFVALSLDVPLHQIQSCIRAASLDAESARYLALPEGAPILSVRSTIYTVENRPVVYSKICFNSDIVELNIVRTLPHDIT